MKLYQRAKDLLSVDRFDRKRCLASRKLYHMAKGKERELIGLLFESQIAMIEKPEDFLWLSEIDKVSG